MEQGKQPCVHVQREACPRRTQLREDPAVSKGPRGESVLITFRGAEGPVCLGWGGVLGDEDRQVGVVVLLRVSGGLGGAAVSGRPGPRSSSAIGGIN